jgi:predicted GTPase
MAENNISTQGTYGFQCPPVVHVLASGYKFLSEMAPTLTYTSLEDPFIQFTSTEKRVCRVSLRVKS